MGILDGRIDSLMSMVAATAYNRKKQALEVEFKKFLLTVDINKTQVGMASPRDICRFLAWKDRMGRTSVHNVGCPALGSRLPCNCPKRLAVGTVENMVGRLRATLRINGKGRGFDETSQSGNPAASLMVGSYVNAIKMEQSIAHACPKQAVPLFVDKLELIASYIDRQLQKNTITFRQRFVFLRDQALFKFMFFSGDRASDVGRMLTQEIKSLPNNQGFLVKHTWGKTFRVDRANVFSIHRCENQLVCPISGLEQYIAGAQQMDVDLRFGYLFRPVGQQQRVLEAGLSYEAVYDRLKTYLCLLGIHQGETPHGLRGGCAITMALLGGGPQAGRDIMQHVGWFSKGSMERYTRMGRISGGTSIGENMAGSILGHNTCSARVFSDKLDDGKMDPAFV